MSKLKSSESVRVVVRCRPMNGKEKAASYDKVVDVDVKLGQVSVKNPKGTSHEMPKTFTFDAVYDWNAKQFELYDETFRPLVDSVLQGFNGTIFAYGQTGTGKTYTMEGVRGDPEKRGVIPNSFDHIFTHIKERQELEQTQNELTRELKLKHLIIENFIPLEEKNKIMNRSFFDDEEDHWKLHPITRLENQQMMKRPVSAVGYKRPLSQHARMSMMIRPEPRYRAENIMLLELDMPSRTTRDYEGPAISPKVQAALDAALQDEDEIQGDDKDDYWREQQEKLEIEKRAIVEDHSLVAEEKMRLLKEKEKKMEDLRREKDAAEMLGAKIKAMESKLLVGGKNIVDHTNEQQKILEQKRQEIAEQKRREREIQQQMESRDEETLELKETYTSLQQEVDIKTKKLKKLFSKLQAVKAEIHDLQEEHIKERQELEQTQNELTLPSSPLL